MPQSRRGILKQMNVLSQVTFAFASALLVSLFIGYQLDRWRGTGQTYTIFFFVLGILAGLKSMYRTVQELSRSLQNKE